MRESFSSDRAYNLHVSIQKEKNAQTPNETYFINLNLHFQPFVLFLITCSSRRLKQITLA